MLCVCATYAISYASPYKGSGRGFIYTTRSSHSTASSAGLTQAPVVSMGSVSRGVSAVVSSRGVAPVRTMAVAMPAVSSVHGIYTAASAVSGGVTTYDAGASPHRAPGRSKNASWPDNPTGSPDCGCHWVDSGDGETYICPICGCTWNEYEDAGMEHCHCVDESGYCWCPLDMDWSVLAFLSLLSFAYIAYKKRQKMSNFVKTVF